MTAVTRNIGRLGNNMFQIANSIGYARKYGYQWAADESHGHGEPYSSIHKVFPNLPKQHFGGSIRFHEHKNEHCEQHGTHKDYCHFDYHDIPDMGPDVAMTGFFQSWKYFEHCKEEVREVFKLPHVEGYEDYCSIHIRLGDYKQHSGSFPPITDHYILLASLEIERENPDIKYLIFSDGIDECKEMFDTNFSQAFNDRVYFCNEPDELKSLSLMASCGHHIIANSSFSWWASYLGHNPNRIVISPSASTWFGPTAGVKKPVNDLILPEWIQIPTR